VQRHSSFVVLCLSNRRFRFVLHAATSVYLVGRDGGGLGVSMVFARVGGKGDVLRGCLVAPGSGGDRGREIERRYRDRGGIEQAGGRHKSPVVQTKINPDKTTVKRTRFYVYIYIRLYNSIRVCGVFYVNTIYVYIYICITRHLERV